MNENNTMLKLAIAGVVIALLALIRDLFDIKFTAAGIVQYVHQNIFWVLLLAFSIGYYIRMKTSINKNDKEELDPIIEFKHKPKIALQKEPEKVIVNPIHLPDDLPDLIIEPKRTEKFGKEEKIDDFMSEEYMIKFLANLEKDTKKNDDISITDNTIKKNEPEQKEETLKKEDNFMSTDYVYDLLSKIDKDIKPQNIVELKDKSNKNG